MRFNGCIQKGGPAHRPWHGRSSMDRCPHLLHCNRVQDNRSRHVYRSRGNSARRNHSRCVRHNKRRQELRQKSR